MKKLLFSFSLFLICTVAFSLEFRFPFYGLHLNNFLNTTTSGTYNNSKIIEIEEFDNVFGAGVGLGVDFVFDNRSFWWGDGIFVRVNGLIPYYMNTSDVKIKSIIGGMNANDSSTNISNSFTFELAVGSFLLLRKNKTIEIPLYLGFIFPRVSFIDKKNATLGKEGVADFGILLDCGLNWNVSNNLYLFLGARYNIGIAFGGYKDAKLPAGVEILDFMFPSQTVGGYLGVGYKYR